MAEAFEVARSRVQKREKALTEAIRTPVGAELLRVLESEFYDCPLMGATPEETAFNLGRRQVVIHLREARDRGVE